MQRGSDELSDRQIKSIRNESARPKVREPGHAAVMHRNRNTGESCRHFLICHIGCERGNTPKSRCLNKTDVVQYTFCATHWISTWIKTDASKVVPSCSSHRKTGCLCWTGTLRCWKRIKVFLTLGSRPLGWECRAGFCFSLLRWALFSPIRIPRKLQSH